MGCGCGSLGCIFETIIWKSRVIGGLVDVEGLFSVGVILRTVITLLGENGSGDVAF